MSQKKKILLIIAAFLIALGGISFCIVMEPLNWNFKMLDTAEYQFNTYEIADDFHKISINTNVDGIYIKKNENNEPSYITCNEVKNTKHTATVEKGALKIEQTDDRKWYEHIRFNSNLTFLTLNLNKEQYDSLLINVTTGSIDLASSIKIGRVDISTTTGDINYHNSADVVQLRTKTGNIDMGFVEANNIFITTSSGDVEISSAKCKNLSATTITGDMKISNLESYKFSSSSSSGDMLLENINANWEIRLQSRTGDINLLESDADEIYVNTTTGNVKGSLKSDKSFVISTDTGDVSVPATDYGGRCEITTTTGDIIFFGDENQQMLQY